MLNLPLGWGREDPLPAPPHTHSHMHAFTLREKKRQTGRNVEKQIYKLRVSVSAWVK